MCGFHGRRKKTASHLLIIIEEEKEEKQNHFGNIFTERVEANEKDGDVLYDVFGETQLLFSFLASIFFFFSRCCEKKSCGNRNETPSDPVVIDR